MIDHNTAVRMNNITLGISIENRDIQYLYDIRVLIGDRDRIIFKDPDSFHELWEWQKQASEIFREPLHL